MRPLHRRYSRAADLTVGVHVQVRDTPSGPRALEWRLLRRGQTIATGRADNERQAKAMALSALKDIRRSERR